MKLFTVCVVLAITFGQILASDQTQQSSNNAGSAVPTGPPGQGGSGMGMGMGMGMGSGNGNRRGFLGSILAIPGSLWSSFRENVNSMSEGFREGAELPRMKEESQVRKFSRAVGNTGGGVAGMAMGAAGVMGEGIQRLGRGVGSAASAAGGALKGGIPGLSSQGRVGGSNGGVASGAGVGAGVGAGAGAGAGAGTGVGASVAV